MAGFWARLLGRKPNNLPPYDFKRSPWRTRKPWPPNLSNMTEKQQFRFERKFKRRIKLKALRPKLNQYIKVTQWSLISFVIVYGVLFHDFAQDPMNPRPGEQPFKGIREKMWNFMGGFWSHTDGAMQDARGAQRLEPLRGRQIEDEGEQRGTSRPR